MQWKKNATDSNLHRQLNNSWEQLVTVGFDDEIVDCLRKRWEVTENVLGGYSELVLHTYALHGPSGLWTQSASQTARSLNPPTTLAPPKHSKPNHRTLRQLPLCHYRKGKRRSCYRHWEARCRGTASVKILLISLHRRYPYCGTTTTTHPCYVRWQDKVNDVCVDSIRDLSIAPELAEFVSRKRPDGKCDLGLAR
jgi:hypothetical protein